MLLELRVRDFAIIDDVALQLGPGLNVLTGETGAGKSLIVGALSLLLGERASADVVRAGAARAIVEAVFEPPSGTDLHALLTEQGIESEDDVLILRREVAAEGRNRAWVNGSPATAGLVGAIGRGLADLHGQHEHQTLLRADEQRGVLDAFGDAVETAARVAAAYAELRDTDARLERLDREQDQAARQAELLRRQADEIERAALRPGEDVELESEATRLEHAEELARLAESLHQELYLSDHSIAARLGAARRTFEQLLRIDASLEDGRTSLDDAFHNAQELGRRLGGYAASIEHDPARLDEVRNRQNLIFRLQARYGESIDAVIETGRRARAELDRLDRAEIDRRTLERQRERARLGHAEACETLSAARRDAARRLERYVTDTLPDLGLAGRFAVALVPLAEPAGHGAEAVEFRVSLNPGTEPGSLARVASGGELSRLMLSIKTVLARVDRVPTLVFDEVDVGIGGRTAHRVAEMLKRVALHHQVFVITHLAQLAARADHHLLVEKDAGPGSNVAVSELRGEDRIRELARLLGGDPESEVSLEHARELLGAAAA